MNCNKCGKNNRPEAKYCRFCGEALAVESTQKGLIAKDSLVPQLDQLDKKLKVAKANLAGGTRIGMDSLILGDSGTGKNFVAQLVSSKMLAAGVVKQAPRIVDAADWGDFASDFDKNIAALKEGILVITNAQKLLPTTRAKEVNQLDKLFRRMHGTEGAPVVLLCGMLNDMLEFLAHNKAEHSLFEFEFHLDAFTTQDLTRLTTELLEEKYKVKCSEPALQKLSTHFAWYMRQTEVGYSNGHLSEMVAETLFVNAASRGSKTIEEQDIDSGKCFIPKSEEEVLAELDQYIGLQGVKDKIRDIVRNVKARKEGGMKEKLLTDHYIFTGNPGTGKTTFARKFGEVLNAIGALPTGQFVEISGKDFIGQYVGDSEANVKNYVNKAMGGVLFIDEAYALNGGSGEKGSFGMDAVNTLLNLLENRKGEFVCIMAGYTREMAEFVRMNPGIPSRCNVTIDFPDYSAKELEQVFRMFLVRNGETRNGEPVRFTLDAKADEMAPKVFERMYLKRTDTFGNAREVRNLFDAAVTRHRSRGATDDVLTYADLVGEEATKELSLEEVMKEMDRFVGMNAVKDAIRRIAQEIAVQKRLVELGEGAEGLTKFNFILTGNPGTGKTSVANTLGKIFYALGVTSTDHVTKKEPKDIISQYNNESAKVMDAAITEAMGGILFIDEAYGLNPVDETGRGTSSEGKKALETLMTRMENEAGKFVVICAGYPKEMDDFLKANPGLPRRFSHRIHIDDYSAEELLEIYERAAKAKKYNFTLADDAVRMKALNMFQNMVAMKDERFGNAGEAMKKVAETKTNINNRLMAHEGEWTPEVLASARVAYLEDIPYEEPEKVSIEECLAELNELIGLEGVKQSLTKLAHTINNEIESARQEGRRPEIPLGHYLFLGNPGTGKTTVARLMGKILYSMGALPSPKVVEVDKSKLVGRYLGETPAITSNVINSAMGGILFIDEAYQLSNEGYNGGGYGKEALETLLKRLEDDRGKFVCIAAGYSYEMQSFIEANSGIESRFPRRNWITFEDYKPEELFRIFMLYAHKAGYTLDPMAENAVRAKLTQLYNNRQRTFGNARDARNLFDEVKSNLAARLAEEGGTHTNEERKTIMMEDVL
ncbi:MAG: AAA family ATPase [Candidatus Cryptobacteroides sp.]|nr:AAA family ATPase [Candidatus Cryptobacteroides sp.]